MEKEKTVWIRKYLFLLRTYILIFALVLFDLVIKAISSGVNYKTNLFINIISSQNTGSAFSIFSNTYNYNLFIIFSSIVILILINYYFISLKFKNIIKLNKNKLSKCNLNPKKLFLIVFILINSGIIGNLYDRILFKYVRDYLAFGNFFICNLADIYLFFAFIFIILLNYDICLTNKDKRKK